MTVKELYTLVMEKYQYCTKTGKLYKTNYKGEVKEAGTWHDSGYRKLTINYKSYYSHRVVWLMHNGDFPCGQIDHINGIRNDNRIENLREVSSQENSKNACILKSNKSGATGVRYRKDKNCWVAYIGNNGTTKHLGCFDTLDAALRARKDAELCYGFHKNHGRANNSM